MNNNDILAYGPWENDEVNIIFDNALVENDEKTKIYIKDIWSEYCKKRVKYYDSKLLRLSSWNKEDEILELYTGITYYSHYIGTRDPVFKERCLTGIRANPIGMTIIPITSDRNIVITKRSGKMEQNPNKLYFCGGYAEPKFDEKNSINLMNEALREVNEELGANEFLYFNFIGLAYDPVYCHPELFSTAVVNVTKEQIISTWSNAKDRDESEFLLFLSLDDVCNHGFNKFNIEATWSYRVGVELFTTKVVNKISDYYNNKSEPFE
ncbi:NUDIX hydrolase [Geosporobacter ferrireducens]|uniref:Nudix hydrolase domain-containing protein n=1 Tax=Geosporobacter ferrireducens TaxID=1424294 RepID=A0A1D8GNM9_9FIRM|nr:NUDIX hydrolase [Geosporobacter ferrireducens]AOT72472.1 hypothetical protein Gferi_24730 [Geosporobacter ferrireducens]MTI56264.1 NUDIX hydrolase [Geosporobacter ferrireducens]